MTEQNNVLPPSPSGPWPPHPGEKFTPTDSVASNVSSFGTAFSDEAALIEARAEAFEKAEKDRQQYEAAHSRLQEATKRLGGVVELPQGAPPATSLTIQAGAFLVGALVSSVLIGYFGVPLDPVMQGYLVVFIMGLFQAIASLYNNVIAKYS